MFNVDQTTIDSENDGVWAEFKGSEFLIASTGSTRFQRLFAKLQLPHQRDIRKNRLDPEVQLDIMAKAMSKTLLLDWKNVVNNDGELVEYDADTAFKVLKNNSGLRQFVSDFALELENYVEETKEDLGKPVEKSSSGTHTTELDKAS
jgi:hypothetical protein